MSANAAKVESGTFTTSDGVKLHYLEAGKGLAIVFVPGWTMPAWIWEGQIHHFAEHYQVVVLDPGCLWTTRSGLTRCWKIL